MKKRHSHGLKGVHAATLTVLLAAGMLMAACNNKPTTAQTPEAATADSTQSEATTTDDSQDKGLQMKAPDVKTNAAGLILLSDCPKTHEHLSVALTADNDKATISYDGKTLQTIKDEDGLVAGGGEVVPVYFLDANFDGYTDIFIGPGESRTYNTLLLWDNDGQQFVRVGTLGEPMFQGVMLHPASKTLIDGGSGSFCSFFIFTNKWDGYKLKKDKELAIITQASEYGEYDVENRYTVRDAEGNVSVSTDDMGDLSDLWQDAMKAYEVE